jgi:hypothetical protein
MVDIRTRYCVGQWVRIKPSGNFLDSSVIGEITDITYHIGGYYTYCVKNAVMSYYGLYECLIIGVLSTYDVQQIRNKLLEIFKG